MKKLIISSVLGLALAASSAFGQGWFVFGASPHTVWDATSSTAAFNTSDDVAFLWAPVGSTPAVDAIMATTVTNNTTQFSYTTAWTDITTDPNFTIAQSNSVSYVTGVSTSGSYNYGSSSEFAVQGTAGLTSYALYIIAWNTEGGTLTTPAQAAAANAPVGWSTTIASYQAQSAPPLGSSPGAMGPSKFGVGYYPTPEPTTLALAGLGGISMLFLRRRKA